MLHQEEIQKAEYLFGVRLGNLGKSVTCHATVTTLPDNAESRATNAS